jgi:hypothetical protein
MSEHDREMSEAVGAFTLAARNFRACAEEAVTSAREATREARNALTLRPFAPVVPLIPVPAREG